MSEYGYPTGVHNNKYKNKLEKSEGDHFKDMKQVVLMLHTHPGGFQTFTGDLNRSCNFDNEDSHTLSLLNQN